MLVHGRRRYFRAGREAVRSLLAHTDFEVVAALGPGRGPAPPRARRVRRVRLPEEPAVPGRAGRFLRKLEAIRACLHASDAPLLLLLDADAVFVAPTRGPDVRRALGEREIGMVEQTGIRGSGMGRAELREHYTRHALAFIAPDRAPPPLADFRFYNSGVVLGTRAAFAEIAEWTLGRVAAAARARRAHQVGEHMISDQDYFQVWANQLHPERCAELDAAWNHCEHWDAPFPQPGARILHFSNFCDGPTHANLARMRAARRGRPLPDARRSAGSAWTRLGPARSPRA